ncbi:MAG: hydrogenase maturation protease [Nocardioidaceae bacterium]
MTEEVARRILVAGVGNIFFGDDGFGPEVVRRMAAQAPGMRSDDVRLVDYGIRGMHLAYDLLDGYHALVIVDALPATSAAGDGSPPGSLTVLKVGPDDLGSGVFDAHGMDPVAVLANLGPLGGELPPTYVVGCHPASIEEGIGLSDAVSRVVDEAVALTRHLVDDLLTSTQVGTR